MLSKIKKALLFTLIVTMITSMGSLSFASSTYYYFDEESFTSCQTAIDNYEAILEARDAVQDAFENLEDAQDYRDSQTGITYKDYLNIGYDIGLIAGSAILSTEPGLWVLTEPVLLYGIEDLRNTLINMHISNEMEEAAKAQLEAAIDDLEDARDDLEDAIDTAVAHRKSHSCIHRIH